MTDGRSARREDRNPREGGGGVQPRFAQPGDEPISRMGGSESHEVRTGSRAQSGERGIERRSVAGRSEGDAREPDGLRATLPQ